jgi:hypothetical protein
MANGKTVRGIVGMTMRKNIRRWTTRRNTRTIIRRTRKTAVRKAMGMKEDGASG